MSKSKSTTKTKAAKKAASAKDKNAKGARLVLQIKKDANGRFWVVPKDGGQEHGPFDTKAHATEAKAAIASGATPVAADAKPAKGKKAAKAKEPKAKRPSAIDAAAQVLAASGEPMNCKALIETMAAQGLWESPGGKTPHATLYSAILREINEKGKDARFVKKDRGLFAANAA